MNKYKVEKSIEYNKRLKKTLPGGIHYNMRTPWKETPVHFTMGKDSRLWDMDGNEYLDLSAKFGSMILGHTNTRFNEYMKFWFDKVLSVNHCEIDADVCEYFVKHFPSIDMIRYGLSGTEIVQNALRLARAHTGKNRFVRFEGHFHGSADNILGGKVTNREYPVPTDRDQKNITTAGRALDALEGQSFMLPWNDFEALESLVADYADEIAAIITEPYCINGGGVMPLPGYLEKMRELCDLNNIVLIFDEVITGMRVGLGGAQKELGVTPDLTTLGKAISGCGIPVSALGGKKEIMELYEKRAVLHAGTYNGYVLGAAAIKATFDIFEDGERDYYADAGKKANRLYDVFKECARDVGLPLVIQGPPLCATYHCHPEVIRRYDELTDDIILKDIIINNSLASYGILVTTISRMYPNITLSDDDIDFFEDRIEVALLNAKESIKMMSDAG